MDSQVIRDAIDRLPNAVGAERTDVPCYFLHIPQTAGSTLSAFLESLFLPSELWHRGGLQTWDNLLKLTPEQLRQCRVINGHFAGYLSKLCPSPLRYLTFIRDPLARAVSHHEHVLRDESHYFHALAKELGTFAAYLRDERTQPTLVNFQLRCIGAVLDPLQVARSLTAEQLTLRELERRLDTMPLEQTPEELLQTAAARLDQMCFVGVTERFTEGFALLCELFGWPKPDRIEARNVNPRGRSVKDLSSADLRLLKRLNEADLELHHIAKKRFERDWTRSRFVYPWMHAFVSYAQNAEDVLLHRALRNVKQGTYVDVGANDPAGDSVTKAFYDRGWRGINVEPVTSLHQALVKQRSGDVNIQAAAGAAESERTLYEIPGTGLSTLDANIATRHRKQGFKVNETSVQVRTLRSILAESPRPDIHFLKIDVEGWERDVLRGIDLTATRPWIILVEATEPNTDIPSHREWERLLLKHGYSFVFFDGLNRYYLAREKHALRKAFSRPVNCGDVFVRASEVAAARALREAQWNIQKQVTLAKERAGNLAQIERRVQAAETGAHSLEHERDALRRELDAQTSARATENEEAIRQIEALKQWATSADTHGKSLLAECEKLRAVLKGVSEAREAERGEAIRQVEALTKWATSADTYGKSMVGECDRLRSSLKGASETLDAERTESAQRVIALTERAATAETRSSSLAGELEALRASLQSAHELRDLAQAESTQHLAALKERAALADAHTKTLADECERLRESLKASSDAHDGERAEVLRQVTTLTERASSAELHSKSLADQCSELRVSVKTTIDAREAERAEATRRIIALTERAASADRYGKSLADDCSELRASVKTAIDAREAERAEATRQIIALTERAASADRYGKSLADECSELRASAKSAIDTREAERAEATRQIIALTERAASADRYGKSLADECSELRASAKSAIDTREAERAEATRQIVALTERAALADSDRKSLRDECAGLRASLKAAIDSREGERAESARQIVALIERATLADAHNTSLTQELKHSREQRQKEVDVHRLEIASSRQTADELTALLGLANEHADALRTERTGLHEALREERDARSRDGACAQGREDDLQARVGAQDRELAASHAQKADLEAALQNERAERETLLASAESLRERAQRAEERANALGGRFDAVVENHGRALMEWRTERVQLHESLGMLEGQLAGLRRHWAVRWLVDGRRPPALGVESGKQLRKRKIGIFTIASKNYLAYARVLLKSAAAVHPEYSLFLCLVDKVDGAFDPAAEPFKVVESDSIGVPRFEDMALRYDIMEFNTAIKPFMFQWLLDNTDLDSVIYIDPDIRVYSRLDKLEAVLASDVSVVLTPHITNPIEDGKNPNDYHMLQAGVFNLGFAAINRCEEARRFVEWWGRRLETQASVDLAHNLFTDQRWCDLAPCFVDRLHVFKRPGYNVAYWNLTEREISRVDGQWLVNGEPLAFFHFSGINVSNDDIVSKHQNRFEWADLPAFKPLFDDYRGALIREGWEQTQKWPYVYGKTSSGMVLPTIIRQLYREAHPDSQDLRGSSIDGKLQALCNSISSAVPHDPEQPLTTLMELIYRRRPDLQAAFNLGTREGRGAFCGWYASAALREYKLPAEFVPAIEAEPASTASPPPVRQSGQEPAMEAGSGARQQRPSRAHGCSPLEDAATAEAIWGRLPPNLKRLLTPLVSRILAFPEDRKAVRVPDDDSAAMGEGAPIDDSAPMGEGALIGDPAPMGEGALIGDPAPTGEGALIDDPAPTGEGAPIGDSTPAGEGVADCDCAPEGVLCVPLRSRIDALHGPAPVPQLLSDGHFITLLMHMVWRSRPDLRAAFDLDTVEGQAGFVAWFEASASREYGFNGHAPARPDSYDSNTDAAAASTDRHAWRGANLVGYAHAELGMGEHVRMSAAAFEKTAVQFGVVNFNVGVISRQEAMLEHGQIAADNPFVTNVFHVNADQMFVAYRHLGHAFFRDRYNIGYWAWELAKCPDEFLAAANMVDEIWAPSRFIQQAFAERSDIPVEYMPLCVTLPEFKQLERSHFGLPERAYIFLYTFDFYSFLERKNPAAAIAAFKLAFPEGRSDACLVLKVMNGQADSPQWLRMLQLIDGDPRIIIMNQTLSRSEVLALFDASDCFVSLHRSEGFGRGPAEAMYLGKPVIVTNYSGNTDFTLADNSCLVEYTLVPVEAGQYPFHHGQQWADASVEHAAWFMRKLHADSAYAREIGASGRAYMHAHFNQHSIGARYESRLKRLALG
jgi:FkbM family methyltransferase